MNLVDRLLLALARKLRRLSYWLEREATVGASIGSARIVNSTIGGDKLTLRSIGESTTAPKTIRPKDEETA